jgi:hypothetical protein
MPTVADEPTQACLCGGREFERVTIDRPGGAYVTQFLACRNCGVMYYAPIKPARWSSEPIVPTSPRRRS